MKLTIRGKKLDNFVHRRYLRRYRSNARRILFKDALNAGAMLDSVNPLHMLINHCPL